MVKFLFTAAVVLIGLFIIVLLLTLMTWVILKLLRLLFPGKFPAGVVVLKKRKDDVA